MEIQTDQSNKIEHTNKDTIIGLSNGTTFTVLISSKVKRQLQEEFRKQGRPRLFVYRTFIAGVVLALKYAKLNNISKIIIDEEYFGKNNLLKSIFLEMWSRFFTNIPEIIFERITRKSNAHNISYLTMRGKYPPKKTITLYELKRLVLK